jgi:hypothetical protein
MTRMSEDATNREAITKRFFYAITLKAVIVMMYLARLPTKRQREQRKKQRGEGREGKKDCKWNRPHERGGLKDNAQFGEWFITSQKLTLYLGFIYLIKYKGHDVFYSALCPCEQKKNN